MPRWGYSLRDLDPTTTVKASLREVDVSPKWSREVCAAIKGMRLEGAKKYLQAVIERKRMVPYRRHSKLRGHHSETRGPGGYPVKVAGYMLKLLDSLEANAEFKGLDTDRLVIIHAAAHRGRSIMRFMPRAFGRSSPKEKALVHVEVVGAQL